MSKIRDVQTDSKCLGDEGEGGGDVRLLILFISRSNKGDGGGNRRSPDADQIGYRMYIGQASEVYIHPRAGSQSRDIIYTRSVLSAMIMLYIIVPLLVTCTES